MKNLLCRIEKCEDCRKFGAHFEEVLKFKPKACVDFHVYDSWSPQKVKNLFIAEAPPQREPKYFYNTEMKAGGLRRGLFNQMKIRDCTINGLKIFSKENLLVDTIKCRLKKKKSKVPIEITNNCAGAFLLEEIETLRPNTIVLLGDTARRGLGSISEFKALNKYRVKQNCGKTIQVKDYRVILYAYPSTRNTNIMKTKPLLELLT